MSVQIVQQNGKRIALIESGEQNLTDVDSALEILGTVQYETGCDAMIFPKTSFPEEFFDLRTRLAGDILQKFVLYQMRIAIVGDFSRYDSKALSDFILESNKGRHIFFTDTVENALRKLSV